MAEKKVPEGQEGGAAAPDEVLLNFQQNRPFELTLGGRVVARFSPNGSAKVPRSMLKHPDFQPPISGWFSVQEVPDGYKEAD